MNYKPYYWKQKDYSPLCGSAPNLRDAIIVCLANIEDGYVPTERQKENIIKSFNYYLQGDVKK